MRFAVGPSTALIPAQILYAIVPRMTCSVYGLLLRGGSSTHSAVRSAQDASIRLLAIPNNLPPGALPRIAVETASEWPDAIILTEWNSAQLIESRVPAGAAAVVPVIDAVRHTVARGGLNFYRADVQIKAAPTAIHDAITMLRPVIDRVRQIPPHVRQSNDPRTLLLARLMVRERGLAPYRDPNTRDTVAYADELAIPGAVYHGESLAKLGLLRRQFFDKLTVCPACESARLCVREQCAACGSTHLVEEAIFHHFRCAHQGLERDFRWGGGYRCPKCHCAVEYFSIDYDRPGSVLVCNECGHVSGEASVGFVCLDCELETRAADTDSRTVFSYELTRGGVECLLGGSFSSAASEGLNSGQRIREFAARQRQLNCNFCVLVIELGPAQHTTNSRSYQQTSALFYDLLRETFVPETEIIEEIPRFFVLLAGEDAREVEVVLPEIKVSLQQFLSWPHEIHYQVHGPDEVSTLISDAERGDFGSGSWMRSS